MNTLSMLSLTAALGLAGGLALETPAAALMPVTQGDLQETATGKVKSIDSAAKSFVINSGAEGAKDVTVRTDDKTVFMLDGKISTMSEVVKSGATVTVTHKAGLASKVEGHSK